jgi:hypothetical protein
MYRIIDGRGTGKTSHLMLLAKENNAIFVCGNPSAMREKAKYYGIDGIEFVSYHNFVTNVYDGNYVIDELEGFLNAVMGKNKLIGYTLSIE